MPYTTTAIVRTESPFNDDTLIADTYVDRAIDQADSYIDGYIGRVYSLPLSSTPSLIQHLSTTQAIIYLLMDQNINIEIAAGINIADMQAMVDATLDNILNRRVRLFDTSGDELATTDAIIPSFYPTQTSTDAGTTPVRFDINMNF